MGSDSGGQPRDVGRSRGAREREGDGRVGAGRRGRDSRKRREPRRCTGGSPKFIRAEEGGARRLSPARRLSRPEPPASRGRAQPFLRLGAGPTRSQIRTSGTWSAAAVVGAPPLSGRPQRPEEGGRGGGAARRERATSAEARRRGYFRPRLPLRAPGSRRSRDCREAGPRATRPWLVRATQCASRAGRLAAARRTRRAARSAHAPAAGHGRRGATCVYVLRAREVRAPAFPEEKAEGKCAGPAPGMPARR